MGIAQGATPYLMINVEGHDLTGAAVIKVSLKAQARHIVLGLDRVTVTSDTKDSLLTVHLTQEETLSLIPSTATVQVRWRDGATDEAYTTEIARVDIATALYKGVI